MLYQNLRKRKDPEVDLLSGIENAKFRRPVVPGDQLRIEVEMVHAQQFREDVGTRAGGSKLAAEAVEMFAIADRPVKHAHECYPTAIIHPRAQVASSVTVAPTR